MRNCDCAPWLRRARAPFVYAVPLVALFAGCGRSDGLVDVSGTVTLDGKPVADAVVQFTPAANEGSSYARPVTGRTNSSGHYFLEYSTAVTGTKPGKYRVSISTYWPQSVDSEDKVIPGNSEKLPEVFNSKSTLTAEVKENGQRVDFDLKSDAGKVVQPDAPRKTGAVAPSRSSHSPAASRS